MRKPLKSTWSHFSYPLSLHSLLYYRKLRPDTTSCDEILSRTEQLQERISNENDVNEEEIYQTKKRKCFPQKEARILNDDFTPEYDRRNHAHEVIVRIVRLRIFVVQFSPSNFSSTFHRKTRPSVRLTSDRKFLFLSSHPENGLIKSQHAVFGDSPKRIWLKKW